MRAHLPKKVKIYAPLHAQFHLVVYSTPPMTFSAPRFYCPLPLVPGIEIALPEAAAHHAVRVLRLHEGDAITLFNGAGGEYTAAIHSIGKNAVVVTPASHHPVERESGIEVTLVQALASGEKMDWMIQKAVELGATRIQPVATRRCVLRLDTERAVKRVAHWQSVVVSACEQSGRNRVPAVLAVCDLTQALAAAQHTFKIALTPGQGSALNKLEAPSQPLTLFVGPEGGFDADEINAMRHRQCCFVTLGPRVLRTETAGAAALAAMQTLWGDWKD